MKGFNIPVISVNMWLLGYYFLRYTKNQNLKGLDIPVISVNMRLLGYQILRNTKRHKSGGIRYPCNFGDYIAFYNKHIRNKTLKFVKVDPLFDAVDEQTTTATCDISLKIFADSAVS